MQDGAQASVAVSAVPAIVQQALELAQRMGFEGSCTEEVGRLQAVLAGGVRSGVIAEIGTGCGVGAAWIASALRPGVSLVTVENDTARAEAVRELFAGNPKVRTIADDWHVIQTNAPFSMIFADGGRAKEQEPETLLQMLVPGGFILLDDLTPLEHWPPEWRGQPDPVREFWLNDQRLHATELRPTATTAVILASRRST
jgi:predicted O-methyltransferase YrrM